MLNANDLRNTKYKIVYSTNWHIFRTIKEQEQNFVYDEWRPITKGQFSLLSSKWWNGIDIHWFFIKFTKSNIERTFRPEHRVIQFIIWLQKSWINLIRRFVMFVYPIPLKIEFSKIESFSVENKYFHISNSFRMSITW